MLTYILIPWQAMGLIFSLFDVTVQSKHNVALARMSQFARDVIIAGKRGMTLILLVSIQPYKCFNNTCKQNGCNAPLIDNYSITSKSTCACECDVALGLYRT